MRCAARQHTLLTAKIKSFNQFFKKTAFVIINIKSASITFRNYPPLQPGEDYKFEKLQQSVREKNPLLYQKLKTVQAQKQSKV